MTHEERFEKQVQVRNRFLEKFWHEDEVRQARLMYRLYQVADAILIRLF